MNYTRTNIFDYVYRRVNTQYPSAYIAGKFEPVPASFPAVLIRRIGEFAQERNRTFSGAQGVMNLTYEVQITSNKTNSPATEAWEISDTVTTAFSSMHFALTASNVIEDGEKYRLVLTYRRIVGYADAMPTVPTVTTNNEGE